MGLCVCTSEVAQIGLAICIWHDGRPDDVSHNQMQYAVSNLLVAYKVELHIQQLLMDPLHAPDSGACQTGQGQYAQDRWQSKTG